MSDSELSDAPSNDVPPEEEIEATLRKEVTRASKGPVEQYTVSRIRKAAEEVLGLPDGFLKENENWRGRSKSVIEKQVEVENAAQTSIGSQKDSKQPEQSASKSEMSTKRSSTAENKQPRKKQKVESDEETSALSSPPDDSEDDFEEKKFSTAKKDTKKPTPIRTKTKPVSKPKAKAKAKVLDNVSEDDEASGKEASEEAGAESGSEMSEVLDEAPPKKLSSKSKSVDASKEKSSASKSKSKANTSGEPDPDQEEIKKLQGWLVKCGIRKVWGKELKPFETPKAKIKHLRSMLSDAGMTGRFSNEKAAQIKEARELAADIEAVQEGNERWGKDGEDDDEGDSNARGGRRLVRGAKAYDFLSSDGEETD